MNETTGICGRPLSPAQEGRNVGVANASKRPNGPTIKGRRHSVVRWGPLIRFARGIRRVVFEAVPKAPRRLWPDHYGFPSRYAPYSKASPHDHGLCGTNECRDRWRSRAYRSYVSVHESPRHRCCRHRRLWVAVGRASRPTRLRICWTSSWLIYSHVPSSRKRANQL
jgi:hypothetical protein